MTGGDLFAAIELEAEIFSESDRWTESMLTEELTRPDRLYLGAFADKELVGMIGVRVAIDTDLMTVGVHPDWQGRGLASSLFHHLLETLRRVRIIAPNHFFIAEDDWQPPREKGAIERSVRRVERILLEVRASNEPALRLYEGHGFHEVSRIPRYYHRPEEDALVMEYVLSPES